MQAHSCRSGASYANLRRLPCAGFLLISSTWIDRADHIEALLDATGAGQPRAMIATMTLAGLRIGEMISLRWTDVDLARGTINVRRSKTAAGIRTIYLLPALRDHLDTLPRGDHLVFPTSTGNQQQPSNIRRRVLAPAVALANEQLDDPLPTGLTPHSLRRTFASILFALGEQPPYVMQQMGHTTPNLTLALYARHMQRRDGEPERLRALIEGAEWANDGPMEGIGHSPGRPMTGQNRP